MPRPFHVLLVEDDDPLRRCLKELLAERGWFVHDAGSGPEGLALARTQRIDFSLVDMHLPGMSGLDLVRALTREGRELPAIVMSGDASKEEQQRLLAERCVFQFLDKPLDLQRLQGSMDSLIHRHFGLAPGDRRA
jgi:CheY-like chemotaxis protein